MKLYEFEIGQTVVDKFGNIYEVKNVSHKEDDYQPVQLLCIKNSHSKNYVTKSHCSSYEFKAGCEWWINEDELEDFSIVEN